ncbi:MAG TPA: hypothetical protein PKA41_04225 [Verrucomicrobiota bacterium]|nr:hypothetical protein [Verrucomicrobiota bacterium]
MKNTAKSNIRGSLLAVIIGTGMALSGSQIMAADEGQITLEGTVETINEIVVTPEAGYNDLNLNAGESWKLVATVNERNNDPDGYTVTLQSLNADDDQARLKGDQTTSIYVNYSMKYGTAGSSEDADVTLEAGEAVVTSTTTPTGSSGVNKKLTVNIAANSWPDAGVYNDTLTLTIASK